MRAALAITVLAIGVAAAAPARIAQASAAAPTRAQIRGAVARAERSRSLWATVNVCDSHRFPHRIGVRGQMPTLGFAASMSMYVQVNYFSKSKHRFEPIRNATMRVGAGRSATGLEQAGSTFSFPRHTGLLNATIEFTWTRSGTVLAQTTRRTTAGHRDADYGSPPHYSARECRIR